MNKVGLKVLAINHVMEFFMKMIHKIKNRPTKIRSDTKIAQS